MRIQTLGNGVIVIDGDEVLLQKIEGEDLSGIDVSDYRICAESVSQLYLIAESTPTLVNGIDTHENIKRYTVMKQRYLEEFSAEFE